MKHVVLCLELNPAAFESLRKRHPEFETIEHQRQRIAASKRSMVLALSHSEICSFEHKKD